MIDVRVLTGAVLDAALDDVARLRITVFREWPYFLTRLTSLELCR